MSYGAEGTEQQAEPRSPVRAISQAENAGSISVVRSNPESSAE
jgi:hypothetical protein